jgi:hypothetical protein
MIPTPWVMQEQRRRYIIGAMITGRSMVLSFDPRDAQHDAQRLQDQGHQHLRINSQKGTNCI